MSAASFLRLLEVFDRLEIKYMIGGSAASTVYGLARMTRDIDIIAGVHAEDIAAFVAELEPDFYVEAGQIRAALEHSRPFNVIHYVSSYKFDIFPLTADRYHQAEFGRRRYEKSSLFGGEPIVFAVASPEDVVLSKLRWYRLGGEVSEQQWNDVLGVIAVQRERLDFVYLREWASYLEVSGLLDQALAEEQETG